MSDVRFVFNSDSGDACQCAACRANELVLGRCSDCGDPTFIPVLVPPAGGFNPPRCEDCARIAKIFPRPLFIAKVAPRT